ncbi:MAG: hypothetical protein HYY95_03505 [Candidatus Rokubacteria bacterium]|nr:hypothetical protein [Candidatus Rokubacteria bacterium]
MLLLPLLLVPAVALYSMAVKPLRYWIYLTPALAIVLAASADALLSRIEGLLPRSAWPRAAAAALWAAVVLTNVAAIRVEAWRHNLADTYQVLDYIRAADLIRSDLDRSGAPGDALVCVNGLDPPPYAQAWRDTLGTPARLHDHAALAVLAQTLGRRDLSRLRLDCGAQAADGAYLYTVRGAEVMRDGLGIDPFERLHARVRALVAAGDHAAAAALGGAASARPFSVRYVLGPLPDPDMEWMTNGASILAWLHGMAENYDHWFGQSEPKVEAVRRLLVDEVTAYVRFLFLVEYARLRAAPPREGWGVPPRRFAFGALRAEELDAILRSDVFLVSLPQVQPLLDLVTAGSPSPGAPKILNAPPVLPGGDFFAFLWRLLSSSSSTDAF